MGHRCNATAIGYKNRREMAPALLSCNDMARDMDVMAALAVTAIVAISGLWRLIG